MYRFFCGWEYRSVVKHFSSLCEALYSHLSNGR